MTEFDLKRSLYLLKIFLTHPSAAFRDMSERPDVPGALFVMDALSFFTVVAAVVSGALEPTLSLGFILRFIILYAMVLIVFCLLVFIPIASWSIALICPRMHRNTSHKLTEMLFALDEARLKVSITPARIHKDADIGPIK